MRNIYTINQFEIIHNEFHFILNESSIQIPFKPTGQVIADSDNEAFIYIVEEGNRFSYISFPKAIWPPLVELVKQAKDPYLRVGSEEIQLTNFFEELHMLLFNIEGNSNYGEAFVFAVEEAFEEVFTTDEV